MFFSETKIAKEIFILDDDVANGMQDFDDHEHEQQPVDREDKRPDLALIEVPVLWLSILALMFGLAPFSILASWLLLPYLLWVTFAAFLNLTIVRMNRPFGRVEQSKT